MKRNKHLLSNRHRRPRHDEESLSLGGSPYERNSLHAACTLAGTPSSIRPRVGPPQSPASFSGALRSRIVVCAPRAVEASEPIRDGQGCL